MEKNIYGLSTSGIIKGVTDHSDLIRINCPIDSDNPYVIVDSATLIVPKNCVPINTSNFAQLLLMDEEAKEEFDKAFEISNKRPVSAYYCIMGNGKHTPPCEIGYSMRSMNGDVGVEVYLSHACGFLIETEQVSDQIQSIMTYLSSRYIGEIALMLDENGNVCRLVFGHQPHFLAVYAEFFAGNIDDVLSHILESDAECPVFRSGTSLMLAVTKYPYPNFNENEAYIRAEIEAEKHIWRMPYGLIFVTGWSDDEPDSSGTSFSKCRKRIFRTISRARKYDDYLCYRTDIGYSLNYSIVTKRYQALQR